MERRRRRVGVTGALVLVAALVMLPVQAAGAAVDHEAVIVDLQLEGFVAATPDVSYTGPIDENGEPVQPGWTRPPTYRGGYMKNWMSTARGEVIGIIAGEFTTVMQATLEKNSMVSNAAFDDLPGVQRTPLDVPGIPDAVGLTAASSDAGVTVHIAGFNKGAMTYGVVMAGPAPDVATLLSVATEQYAHGPAVDGRDAAFVVGTLVGIAILGAGAVGFLGVVGLIVFLVVRKKRKAPRMAAPPAGWSMQRPAVPRGYADSGSGAIRWGSDVASDAAADVASAQPIAAPVAVATVAPPEPSAWAHPDATPAPEVAPEVVAEAVSRPCPTCGNDFGTTAMCAHCGAARTFCVACGTKIWAGALTCSTHARS